jgi:hypothetical protein
MLLGLPWIGRNAVIADIHNTSGRLLRPPHHWKQHTAAGDLLRGVKMFRHGSAIIVEELNPTDGFLVFHAYGQEISPLHLEAYNAFVDALRDGGLDHLFTREELAKFRARLKTGEAKLSLDGAELDFSAVPSPYDVASDAPCVLTASRTAPQSHVKDMPEMFRSLLKIFGNERYHPSLSKFASDVFAAGRSRLGMWGWSPPKEAAQR